MLTLILTAQLGTITFEGNRETYYNLDMHKVCARATDDNIHVKYSMYNKYWEREDGCKMYGEYIICAADWDKHPYGTLINTSRGTGIVLDTGTFEDRTTVDIATNW